MHKTTPTRITRHTAPPDASGALLLSEHTANREAGTTRKTVTPDDSKDARDIVTTGTHEDRKTGKQEDMNTGRRGDYSWYFIASGKLPEQAKAACIR